MLHRLLLAMALALLPHIALAEAAPFGLPVGTATLQERQANVGTQDQAGECWAEQMEPRPHAQVQWRGFGD